MERSRISFNSVKDLYVNRNLPPIEIEYDNNNVLAINNIDVLFYFFLFMENTGVAPIINDQEQIATVYKKYTKDFYRNHLSDLFIPRCFHYLIERTAEDLPIIPIPERVINSSGAENIHDSFLFPIVKKNSCLWVWESVEELKATYVFETSKVSYEAEVQTIFDFLTGEFVNKRSTLMKRKVDKKSVPLLIRVNHNDYNEWKKKIGEILN
jgi:hypothetical protein